MSLPTLEGSLGLHSPVPDIWGTTPVLCSEKPISPTLSTRPGKATPTLLQRCDLGHISHLMLICLADPGDIQTLLGTQQRLVERTLMIFALEPWQSFLVLFSRSSLIPEWFVNSDNPCTAQNIPSFTPEISLSQHWETPQPGTFPTHQVRASNWLLRRRLVYFQLT